MLSRFFYLRLFALVRLSEFVRFNASQCFPNSVAEAQLCSGNRGVGVFNAALHLAGRREWQRRSSSKVHSAMVQVRSDRKTKRQPRATLGMSADPSQALAVDMRPHLGMRSDIVFFGVFCKGFFGIDFSAKTFSVDLVLTVRWTDTRVAQLVPVGMDNLALPTSSASKHMWLPDIGVTNRDFGGVDVISSMVNITRDGSVTKVERVHAVLKTPFVANAFPFDVQVLRVHVASSTLMLNDLILQPLDDPLFSGVKPGIFDDSAFQFVSEKTVVLTEEDGLLRKSRGELGIVVQRNSWLYLQSVFMPSFLIVSVSWAGFFIPCSMPPFLMPRIATSFISFLAQVTLSIKVEHMQPQRGDVSWLDVFEECCMTLVYAAVCLNIFVQYVNFRLKLEVLADRIDHELQIALPAFTFAVLGLCFLITEESNVRKLVLVERLCLGIGFFGYFAGCLARIFISRREQLKDIL